MAQEWKGLYLQELSQFLGKCDEDGAFTRILSDSPWRISEIHVF